jgi:hypothetical protein
VALPHGLTANEILDELKTQLRPLAEHRLKPDHIEMSEAYAAQLNPRYLKASLFVIVLNERDGPAFGGVPIRLVVSPGILQVVV